MARVVKQRRPPVVAISFAFLFLVAGGLAFLFASKRDEEKQLKLEAQKERDNLKKQVDKLNGQVDRLTGLILGKSGMYLEAVNEEKELPTEIRSPGGGLIDKIRYWYDACQSRVSEINQLKQAKQLAQNDYLDAQKAIDKLREDQESNLKKADDKIAEEIETGKTKLSTAKDSLAEEKKVHNQMLSEKEQNIDQMNTKIDGFTKKTHQLDETIRTKDSKLRELRTKLTPDLTQVENPADGRIIRATPPDTCYVDIGANEGVREGMTFAVIPGQGSGVTDTKGSLMVVQVRKNFSVCKILQGAAKAEDKIANLAYNKGRRYNFIVVGNFDLTGKGVPSPEGKVEIKEAIRTFGGRLDEDLNVQTDFLIKGWKPRKPIEPTDVEKDSPSYQAYLEMMKEYRNYNNYQKLAADLNVAIIDTDKFLKLTGYVPRSKAQ